jgi:hypothetical protein
VVMIAIVHRLREVFHNAESLRHMLNEKEVF